MQKFPPMGGASIGGVQPRCRQMQSQLKSASGPPLPLSSAGGEDVVINGDALLLFVDNEEILEEVATLDQLASEDVTLLFGRVSISPTAGPAFNDANVNLPTL